MGDLQELAGKLAYLYPGNLPSVRTFDGRKTIQKVAYLLDYFGLGNGGYESIWHYEGPFSFKLHFDYYREGNALQSAAPASATPELMQFKGIFSEYLTDIRKLELFSSVLYLNKESSFDFDQKAIVETMKLKKPKFDTTEVLEAVVFLRAICN